MNARRLVSTILASLCTPSRRLAVVLATVVCAVLALGAAPAVAAVEHPFLSSFTGSGTPAKSFGGASGVAVDGSTGDVYVADITNNVVDKFSAAGAYLCQITGSSLPSASECNGIAGSATPAGSFAFSNPAAVAVDNSAGVNAGDVYVVDAGNNVVDKFASSGGYLGQVGPVSGSLLGVGVDGAGNVWVYDADAGSQGTIYEFDPSGNPVLQFNTNHVAVPAFAVDSTGNSYAAAVHGVEKFDSGGQSHGLVEECAFCAVAVATDLSSGEMYADDGTYVAPYDSAGNQVALFGQSQLASAGDGGIAVNPVTGTVYVANATDGKVYVYGPAPGPRALTGVASNVQVTTATVAGTVNPEGAGTTYQFQYGASTAYGQSAPASPVDVGSGSSPVAVSVDLVDLAGGTVYHYRIVAMNANGTFHSSDGTFTTLPVPVIDGVSVTALGASSATLNAQVNPKGLQLTDCHFEYGTDSSYGQTAPCVPGAGLIPADSSDHAVSAAITGLSANTAYHWRIVAQDVNGTSTAVDHVFIYDTSGAGLPDNRSYEMVTPPAKNAASIGGFLFGLQPDISQDGSRVIASSIQCFADASSCNASRQVEGEPFAFTRTAGGWVTTALTPSAQFHGNTPYRYSADAGTVLFGIPTPPAGEDDFYARRPDGSFLDIGPTSPPSPSAGTQGTGPGDNNHATADLSHVVFSTISRWPFDATISNGSSSSTYEYVGAGSTAPVLVGVSGGSASTDLISTCGTEVGGMYNALSGDGRTVFFTAIGNPGCSGSGANAGTPVPANALYARIDQSRTVAVSQRSPADCTSVACLSSPPEDANFEGASVDGSKVFFTSTQQLTDNASQDSLSGDPQRGRGCLFTAGANGCNLYQYDFAGPAGHNLTAVSAGDTSGRGPRVQGVAAISSDGSHVYFVANGVLAPGASPGDCNATTATGHCSLYVFERDAGHPDGHVAFIATLPVADEVQGYSNEWGGGVDVANVTPDGRFLVFASHAALTADVTRTDGAQQVYRYDAQTGELVRLSVGERGFADNGNAGVGDAQIVPEINSNGRAGPPRADPTMSDDGAFVFFTSPIALTPRALDSVRNGTDHLGNPNYAQNVYEWHEGHVSLISDGRDASAIPTGVQQLVGSDATGANVFFTTADQLVPQDTDTQVDYYDARICTASDPCITQPPPPLPPCQGEACHGIPAAAPSLLTPGSVTFSGAGNLSPPVSKPAVRPRSLTRAQKLARALKACRTRHNKRKRATCEKQARKQYAPVKKKGKR